MVVNMKIRLAVIDNDENYVKRFISNLQVNYAEKVEPYFFSDYGLFLDFYRDNIVQVILVDEGMAVEPDKIPEDAAFAWLVSSNAVEKWEGYPAVGKFQKLELLYKSVLSLYADVEKRLVLRGSGKGRCVMFTSAQGGAGTSTAAAAFAMHMAKTGHSVLYLCLDKFQKPEIFFHGDGSQGFSEVIYEVKARKTNLPLKLESIVKRDIRGVQFFDSCRNASDMLECSAEDIDNLFSAFGKMDSFEYIVVDMPMDFSEICDVVMEKYANNIVMLDDGSAAGNAKCQRVIEVLRTRRKAGRDVLIKIRLLYNKFGETGRGKLADPMVDVVGELGFVQEGSQKQIAEKLADCSVMGRIAPEQAYGKMEQAGGKDERERYF